MSNNPVIDEKAAKTPEDLAAIAYLDKLRSGEGETMPEGLPLACVVKVIAYEEVPKAREKYAMATVRGAGNREWRMCVSRYYLEDGMDALFVSKDAALPMEDRFCNRDLVSVKERVYRFGFGVNERRYLPIVKRTIYIHNCGVLFPLDDFPEVKRKGLGADCSALLGIDSAADLQARLSAPRPKQPKARSFVPKAKSKRKPKKEMSFFDKFKAHRDRFFG